MSRTNVDMERLVSEIVGVFLKERAVLLCGLDDCEPGCLENLKAELEKKEQIKGKEVCIDNHGDHMAVLSLGYSLGKKIQGCLIKGDPDLRVKETPPPLYRVELGSYS